MTAYANNKEWTSQFCIDAKDGSYISDFKSDKSVQDFLFFYKSSKKNFWKVTLT